MRTLVFDLDGTLADTQLDLIEAANKVFQSLGHGRVLDPEKDKKVSRLGGGRAMLDYGFSLLNLPKTEAQIEQYYPTIISAYEEAVCVHSALYPGCYKALDRLATAGHPMAVCTNKPGVLALPLLAQLGIDHFFKSVVSAETLSVRKPHPDPMALAVSRAGGELNNAVLFGDSVTDRETARAAGCASVLVTFGPIGKDVLALRPDAVLNHYDEIEGAIAALPTKV